MTLDPFDGPPQSAIGRAGVDVRAVPEPPLAGPSPGARLVAVTDAGWIQQLLDVEQIKQLKARYFRLMDQKRWDEWGEVFAADAVMDVPEANMVTEGRAAIVQAVSGVLTGVQTVHHGHMPEIEITGPDTATGTWAMFDYVEFPPAESGERVGLQGYGHYTEQYVREDGAWRIARTRLERLRIDPLTPTVWPP
jgi:hypothetical protein